jgi:hypothetical protein
MSWLVLAWASLWGCGGEPGGGEAPSAGAPSGDPSCDLSLDNLKGRTFLMHEAQADQSEVENPMARLTFVEEGGQLIARYTAKSIADVYDYPCKKTGEGDSAKLVCREAERIEDWCKALQAHEWGSCSSTKLTELGATMPAEPMKEAIKKAKEEAKKVKDAGDDNAFKRWQLVNNNLGNKLQGRMTVEKEKRKCRLMVNDMYFTIHNGKGLEDFNPVGRNAFIESKTPYAFEDCTDQANLAPYTSAEPPKDRSGFGSRNDVFEYDKEYFFHYVGEVEAKGAKDCTYSFDAYAQYMPAETGVAVQVGPKGVVQWVGKATFKASNVIKADLTKLGIYQMTRYKQCGGGPRERIDSVCTALRLP